MEGSFRLQPTSVPVCATVAVSNACADRRLIVQEENRFVWVERSVAECDAAVGHIDKKTLKVFFSLSRLFVVARRPGGASPVETLPGKYVFRTMLASGAIFVESDLVVALDHKDPRVCLMQKSPALQLALLFDECTVHTRERKTDFWRKITTQQQPDPGRRNCKRGHGSRGEWGVGVVWGIRCIFFVHNFGVLKERMRVHGTQTNKWAVRQKKKKKKKKP